ncbi:sialidase family protein [Phytoactinopolyspora endophytica]|uniref:sialidase family protein n=1 Tax=Phytoactinopolyspora endophytica TaxID=1642495 RepID=UPI00101CED1A|nr:sialidase family protein [Phytoactinopolyspora endophytica]
MFVTRSRLAVLVGTALVAGTAWAVPSSAAQVPADSVAGSPADSVAGSPADSALSGARREAEPDLLTDQVSMYPRGVRLQHQDDDAVNDTIVASVTTFTDRGGEAAIFSSDDDGRSFEPIASVPVSERNGQEGLCCGTLYELPQQVGELPEGTLLYSASVGQNAGSERRMDLDIWQSQDAGHTWSYLSACASAPNSGGLWEPEFSIDAQGRLVCHYADETDALDGTQRLVRVVSDDGVQWGERSYTVQSKSGATRPGMPIVRTLPDGSYVMVFEVCGTPGQYDCAVYSRHSDDGWDWGDPDEHGDVITSVQGRYFSHAPTVTWVEDGTPQGTLLVIGQLLQEADGSIADGNGSTIFVQRNGSSGWLEIAAPIEIPDAYNHWCPNYSSSLIPLANGRDFVELASDLGDDGVCRTWFARGSIRP